MMESNLSFDKFISKCVVKIKNPSSGTGFWISPEGYLITCYHVVENKPDAVEIIYEGKKYKAKVERSFCVGDIAVLKVETNLRPVHIAPLSSSYTLDKTVYAAGYRVESEKETVGPTPIPGILKLGSTLKDIGDVLTLETHFAPESNLGGISGGPVYDLEKRAVIGVFHGVERSGPSISYVLPLNRLLNHLFKIWPSLFEENRVSGFVFDDFFGQSPTVFSPVTVETFLEARKKAATDLLELRGASGEEYNSLVNEKALIGLLPKWEHLFMEEFGAFRRPIKEEKVLEDIHRSASKLLNKKHGAVFHVISGESGCGKSTIVKQIIRRLVEQDDLDRFQEVSKMYKKLKVYEFKQPLDLTQLRKSLDGLDKTKFEEAVYLFHFDDIFAIEEGELDQLFTAIQRLSEKILVYLLATSPSWLFNKSDIAAKVVNYQLLYSIETNVGDMEDEDSIALRNQYITVNKNQVRADLLNELNRMGNQMLLFKLALHQNLTYSQYIQQLFERLERNDPKCLAALLLFSTLSRFYVHFPVTLIKEINKSLPAGDKLEESVNYYEQLNYSGLKLFRIIYGTRDGNNPYGMPDTISPFHDRIAQVIYESWGENHRIVPVLNCSLGQVSIKVFDLLNSDRTTRPILANVFRGYLRIQPGNLNQFVRSYGPIQRNHWIFFEEPIAAHRWINFAKNSINGRQYLSYWGNKLESSREVYGSITNILINPGKIRDLVEENEEWPKSLDNRDYLVVLLSILESLLIRNPIQVELLGKFLTQLGEWAERREYLPVSGPSIYQKIIISLSSNYTNIFQKPRTGENLNIGLVRIIKAYLLNLRNEYITNDILGNKGLMGLIEKVSWNYIDRKEIATSLYQSFLNGQFHDHLPVIFEIFLYFAAVLNVQDVYPIFELFILVCSTEKEFSGLSYTSQAYINYLKFWGRKNRSDLFSFLNFVLNESSSGKLSKLEATAGYPTFVLRLLFEMEEIQSHGSFHQLHALLRPIVKYFPLSYETPFIFSSAQRLHHSFFSNPDNGIDEPVDFVDTQILLNFSNKLNRPFNIVSREFTVGLINHQITVLPSLISSFSQYLSQIKTPEEDIGLQENFRNDIYVWLEQNRTASDAPYLIALTNCDILFDPMRILNLLDLLLASIRLIPRSIPAYLFPLRFYTWWFSEGVSGTNSNNRELLLRGFWKFILINTDKNTSFKNFNKFFMFFVSNFSVEQNMDWWKGAIEDLFYYYSGTMASTETQNYTRRTRRLNEQRKDVYLSRLYFEKIIDVILNQYPLMNETNKEKFVAIVEVILGKYHNEAWSKGWLSKVASEESLNGTDLLLKNLTIDDSIPDVFKIRNHFDFWWNWISTSKKDLLGEVKEIDAFLTREPIRKDAFLILSTLIILLKTNPVFYPWDASIKSMIIKANETGIRIDFLDITKAVMEFLEYTNIHMRKDPSITTHFEHYSWIGNWCLEQSVAQVTNEKTAYILQSLFAFAKSYPMELDPQKAYDAFISISKPLIAFPEGGAISKYYYPWLVNKAGEVDYEEHIRFISENREEKQASYIFMHLMISLFESETVLNVQTILGGWALLRFFIENRLSSQSTTVGNEFFFKYLMKIEDNNPSFHYTNQTIIVEFVELCKSLINHERIVFLIMGFEMLWPRYEESRKNQFLLDVWHSLLYFTRVTRGPNMEVFGKLTRFLSKSILEEKNKTLMQEFIRYLQEFIAAYPQEKLSPKLFSLLCDYEVDASKLTELLIKILNHQYILEDIAYGIKRFYTKKIILLDEGQKIAVKEQIISCLIANIGKKYLDLCILSVFRNETPIVHYKSLSLLFTEYIKLSRPTQLSDTEIFELFKAYYVYEQKSNPDINERLENSNSILAMIKRNSKQNHSLKFFFAFLLTWAKEEKSLFHIVDALSSLLLDTSPQNWRDVLKICQLIEHDFGSEVELTASLPLNTVIADLQNYRENEIIKMKQILIDGRSKAV